MPKTISAAALVAMLAMAAVPATAQPKDGTAEAYYRSQFWASGVYRRASVACGKDRQKTLTTRAFSIFDTEDLLAFHSAYTGKAGEWAIEGSHDFDVYVMRVGLTAACKAVADDALAAVAKGN